MSNSRLPDFRAFFDSVPGLYLVLSPDPDFIIVAVSNAYARATMTERDQIIGQKLFKIFPDNPNNLSFTGAKNLCASLNRVLSSRGADAMSVQKYDIRSPDIQGGGFEERYWKPLNTPVFDSDGILCAIIHPVEDVMENERLKRQVGAGKAIESVRENFRNLFSQTPEMVCILTGPDHVFEFVNDAHIRTLGFNATGFSVRAAQPESTEVHGILDEIYCTGKTAQLHEIPVTVTDRVRYFDLTYAAHRDE